MSQSSRLSRFAEDNQHNILTEGRRRDRIDFTLSSPEDDSNISPDQTSVTTVRRVSPSDSVDHNNLTYEESPFGSGHLQELPSPTPDMRHLQLRSILDSIKKDIDAYRS